MRLAALVALLLPLGAAEVLKASDRYRAVTLEPGQRQRFRVPGLERVTGSTGACVEEGLDTEEPETFWVEATCAGVRTTLVWKQDGTRHHLLACAEDAERPAGLLKQRRALQPKLKSLRGVTACVHDGRVELLGWVHTAQEKKRVAALEAKHGRDLVRDRVEILEEE